MVLGVVGLVKRCWMFLPAFVGGLVASGVVVGPVGVPVGVLLTLANHVSVHVSSLDDLSLKASYYGFL